MAKKNKENDTVEEILDEKDATESKEQKAEDENSEDELALMKKELDAAKEAHVRTLAEYDNYRKRSTREKEAAYGDSKAACLAEILPVLDNFDRALATTQSDIDSFKKGMEMIYTNLCDILTKLGVEAFGEKGEAFDPNIHNGVMHIENEDMEENVISDVFSKGYRIGERILRPAMVQVAN